VEYRNRLRVSHARSILQSGSVSIAETAALVGFDDPFYFSRIFKSITGISPQVYKRDRFIP
jgi:transcriptional regulator GlxA family with amidase domain